MYFLDKTFKTPFNKKTVINKMKNTINCNVTAPRPVFKYSSHLFDALVFLVAVRLRPLGQLITLYAVVKQVQLLVAETAGHFGKLGHQIP